MESPRFHLLLFSLAMALCCAQVALAQNLPSATDSALKQPAITNPASDIQPDAPQKAITPTANNLSTEPEKVTATTEPATETWQTLFQQATQAAMENRFEQAELLLLKTLAAGKASRQEFSMTQMTRDEEAGIRQSLIKLYIAQEKFSQAIAAQKESIALLGQEKAKRYPDLVEGYLTLAQSEQKAKQLQAAYDSASKAKATYAGAQLSDAAQAGNIQFTLGLIEEERKRLPQALAHFSEQDSLLNQAIQYRALTSANPRYAEAQMLHALGLRHVAILQKNPKAALGAIEKAQKITAELADLNGSNAIAKADLDVINASLLKDRNEIKAALSAPAYQWNNAMESGKAAMSKQQFGKAAQYYQQALGIIRTQPKPGEALEITLTALGFSKLQAKQYAAAMPPLQEAVTLAKKRLGAKAGQDKQLQDMQAALKYAASQSRSAN